MSTVGEKDLATLFWARANSTRNVTKILGPYFDSGGSDDTPRMVPPHYLALQEFRIDPIIVPWDTHIDWIRIRLWIGSHDIIRHQILKSDSDRDDAKIFKINQFTVVEGTPIHVTLQAPNSANAGDTNNYLFQMWGTWLR